MEGDGLGVAGRAWWPATFTTPEAGEEDLGGTKAFANRSIRIINCLDDGKTHGL